MSNILLIRYSLILVVMLLGAMTAQAGSLSLQQSISLSLQHNRLLKADQYNVQAAESRQDEAKGHLLPRVDGSYSVMRSNSALTSFGTKLMQQRVVNADFTTVSLNNPTAMYNYQPKLTFTLPLYQGGALWSGRKQAEKALQARSHAHQWLRQQLIFQTIQHYIAWLNSNEQLGVAKKALQASNYHLKNVQQMRKRGLLIDSDVMDAQVRRLHSEVKVSQSENTVAYGRDLLARITATAIDAETLPMPIKPLLLPADMDTLVAQAVNKRPDYQAMIATLGGSRAAVEIEQAAFLPRLSLQATQEWNSATLSIRNGNRSVAAVVSMNLFAGGSDLAALHRRQADRARLSLNVDDKRQQIENEVRQARRQLTESETRSAAEAEVLRQSVSSLRIISLRHTQGLEKTSTLLDAQSRLDQARADAIRAHYDITVAKAQLLLVTGYLNQTSLQAGDK
ncbi:MAG: TolC family protein [Mariprofundus sp.]|nr:TolC family protein [Mariprofundus sp.]